MVPDKHCMVDINIKHKLLDWEGSKLIFLSRNDVLTISKRSANK